MLLVKCLRASEFHLPGHQHFAVHFRELVRYDKRIDIQTECRSVLMVGFDGLIQLQDIEPSLKIPGNSILADDCPGSVLSFLLQVVQRAVQFRLFETVHGLLPALWQAAQAAGRLCPRVTLCGHPPSQNRRALRICWLNARR